MIEISQSSRSSDMNSSKAEITNVLPKNGLVYSERGGLGEVLCKPKILPLKSSVLLKIKQQSEALEEQEEASNSSSNNNMYEIRN